MKWRSRFTNNGLPPNTPVPPELNPGFGSLAQDPGLNMDANMNFPPPGTQMPGIDPGLGYLGSGGFGGFPHQMMGGGPENLLMKEIDPENWLDNLEHIFRRDKSLKLEGGGIIWEKNEKGCGDPEGPLANEAGIKTIVAWITPHVSIHAAVSFLTEEEEKRQLRRLGKRFAVWLATHGRDYQINQEHFSLLLNMVMTMAEYNLSRAVEGREARRQTELYRLGETTWHQPLNNSRPSMMGHATQPRGSMIKRMFGGMFS
jgi:hypothetical protein